MSARGATGGPRVPRHRPAPVAVAVVVAVLAVVGLVAQAARGWDAVSAATSSTSRQNAAVQNAYYRCLDVQVRSVVRPGRPVAIADTDLATVVTLLMSSGSWLDVAADPADAPVELSLRYGPGGPGTCRGTVVVAGVRTPSGRRVVRRGHGAQLPGSGPPPAPPL